MQLNTRVLALPVMIAGGSLVTYGLAAVVERSGLPADHPKFEPMGDAAVAWPVTGLGVAAVGASLLRGVPQGASVAMRVVGATAAIGGATLYVGGRILDWT